MIPIIICIPGTPVGKERPRVNPHTRQAWTPTKTREWEEHARYYMREAMREYNRDPLSQALRVKIVAGFEAPKVAQCSRRMPRLGKPDADNIVKAVLDAGNKIVWCDDEQCAVSIEPVWVARGESARVVLSVEARTELPDWVHELLDVTAESEVV